MSNTVFNTDFQMPFHTLNDKNRMRNQCFMEGYQQSMRHKSLPWKIKCNGMMIRQSFIQIGLFWTNTLMKELLELKPKSGLHSYK